MRHLLSIILANALVIFLTFVSPQLARAAATFTIVNLDSAGEGFNELTPAAPVGGNSGTTLGQQRLNAFQHAANIWGGLINSPVNIRVEASFDPLFCSASGAVLGSAGPNTVHRDFAGAAVSNTWYVQALANSLFGGDLSGSNDIGASFSSIIGTAGCLPNNGWYFGLDGSPPAGRIDFVTVLLHELAHGLGFLSLVSLNTGAKFQGFNDAYMHFLESHVTGKSFPLMTDGERFAASTSTGNLHWTGANVVAESGGGHVRMYAPNSVQGGSSVSHFDTVLNPNELMEPSYTGPLHDVGLTVELFADLGWVFGDQTAPGKITNLKAITPTQQTNITLNWTSPGDDGNGGTATSYDLHVSNARLSEATWNTATAVNDEPVPMLAGSPESITVGNLLCGRTYYFGMKTTDNDNNTSVLSNVATGRTAACNKFSPSPKILPASETGVLYTKTIDLVNGATPFNVLFDVVPAWLTVNAPVDNSFSVTGTPPLLDAGTTVSLAGVISDAVGSVLKAKFTLRIAKPIEITTTTVRGGKVNTNYTATLRAKDGVKAYTWSVDGGGVLPGNAPLNLVAATGKFTVLPTAPGSVDVTFRVTDAAGGTDTQILTLTFN